jgi:hypothetical protein
MVIFSSLSSFSASIMPLLSFPFLIVAPVMSSMRDWRPPTGKLFRKLSVIFCMKFTIEIVHMDSTGAVRCCAEFPGEELAADRPRRRLTACCVRSAHTARTAIELRTIRAKNFTDRKTRAARTTGSSPAVTNNPGRHVKAAHRPLFWFAILRWFMFDRRSIPF